MPKITLGAKRFTYIYTYIHTEIRTMKSMQYQAHNMVSFSVYIPLLKARIKV
jgi:hypothetical protein